MIGRAWFYVAAGTLLLAAMFCSAALLQNSQLRYGDDNHIKLGSVEISATSDKTIDGVPVAPK
jgi:hypothetical protein